MISNFYQTFFGPNSLLPEFNRLFFACFRGESKRRDALVPDSFRPLGASELRHALVVGRRGPRAAEAVESASTQR